MACFGHPIGRLPNDHPARGVVAACAPKSPAINTDAIDAKFRSFILIVSMNIRIAQKVGWREFVAQGHSSHVGYEQRAE